jgi:cytochrome P450
MPHWHPVFGHLKALKENSLNLPRNASSHVTFMQLSRSFSMGIFYVDLYPFSYPLIVVFSPFLASQVESLDLTKPNDIYGKVDAITDGPSLLTMHGDIWKRWRKMFNPGFSETCMMGLADGIAQEVGVFCEVLKNMAIEERMFQLEEATLRLTFDVIGLTSL